MPDERDNASTAEAIIPHPAAFIMPSNYDVLCGSGQAFFHHIGNRRFRIMIEMNIERYEKEYLKVGRGENCEIHEIIAQINQSIAARCDPPGRFLAMDMNTG
jgi:predicted Co/Zn/Cd cation transporter (cation efflux family)